MWEAPAMNAVFHLEGSFRSIKLVKPRNKKWLGLTESIKSLKDRQHNGQKIKEKQLSTKYYTED
jgi:hypothetical protein